ncbi:MAG: hypothetical protein M0004_06115 [Actinomycetota bacterium]|nr:hypothetical protein [Actinomycetota bacterium]
MGQLLPTRGGLLDETCCGATAQRTGGVVDDVTHLEVRCSDRPCG